MSLLKFLKTPAHKYTIPKPSSLKQSFESHFKEPRFLKRPPKIACDCLFLNTWAYAKQRYLNKLFFLNLSLFIFFGEASALAHKVGDRPWCVQMSLSHMVCDYMSYKECNSPISQAKQQPQFFKIPENEDQKKLPPTCVPNPDTQAGQAL